MRAIFRICGNESQPDLQLVCLVPRRVLADSRATGILVARLVSWERHFSRSPFPASFASTLNVSMVHYTILVDGSCSRVFRFLHLKHLGTRQTTSRKAGYAPGLTIFQNSFFLSVKFDMTLGKYIC